MILINNINMEYDELLANLAALLERDQRPYFVTGGFAVSVWGRPRATFDIDIVMVIREEDVPRVARALRMLGETTYVDEETMRREIRKRGEFNAIHPESGLKIDFWVWDSDDALDQSCLKRKVPKVVRGQRVYFISPEDLILSKLKWHVQSGSERQFEDVKTIFKFSEKQLDKAYLKEWAEKLGMSEILSQFLI